MAKNRKTEEIKNEASEDKWFDLKIGIPQIIISLVAIIISIIAIKQ